MKEQREKLGICGRYRFKTYAADPNISVKERKRRILSGEVEPIRVSEWVKNLVVASDGYGLNVITRQLSGDDSIPLEIAEMQIGTGSGSPSASDTGLGTPVATGIIRANQSVSNDDVTLSFFVSDLEIPNGTYSELGIFCGEEGDRRLFARSLISPNYTKSSSEDTTIEYSIELTAT